jgi:predicted nucleotidyltransferase
MKHKTAILERLRLTAEKLGHLTQQLVFVGGSAVPLLITDQAAPDARPTKDVDVVAKVVSRVEFYSLSAQLAKAGFVPKLGDEVICRFHNNDLILDVMPTEENVLGFQNKWFKSGFENSCVHHLSESCSINVITAPYFLCTKLEAYQERRKRDNDEKDLEDVIYIVDGRPELMEELLASPNDVSTFVSSNLEVIIKDGLLSRLDWFLPQDSASVGRTEIVARRLTDIAKLGAQSN